MRILYSLLLIILYQCSHAQNNYEFELKNQYPFINTQFNKIEHFNDDKNYSDFLKKFEILNSTAKGNINIVHIGGSHVQADWFTNTYRMNFSDFEHGIPLSRGFVFPYNLAKTNTSPTYRFESSSHWSSVRNVNNKQNSRLGLAGIAITTSDSLANLRFAFRNNIPLKYEFNSLKLLHPFDSNEFTIRFDTTLVKSMVDYPALGYTQICFFHPQDSFQVEFIKTNDTQNHFTSWGFILESEDAGLSVHNIGVNGASIPSFLDCSDFFIQLPLLQPDLIIIGLGINDAHSKDFQDSTYVSNYNRFILQLKVCCPQSAVILLTNNDSYFNRKKVNYNGLNVEKDIYKIAESNNIAVWNLFKIMGGLKSMMIWQKNKLAQKDKVHFTKSGYEIIGNLLFNAIIEDYYSYLKSKNVKL